MFRPPSSRAISLSAAPTKQRSPLSLGADNHRDNVLLVRFSRLQFTHFATLPQHNRPIGDFDDMLHIVRDDDHGIAVGLELLDKVKNLARLAKPEGGRWFVKDHQLARKNNGARDRDSLSLPPDISATGASDLGSLTFRRSMTLAASRFIAPVLRKRSGRGSQEGKEISRPQ